MTRYPLLKITIRGDNIKWDSEVFPATEEGNANAYGRYDEMVARYMAVKGAYSYEVRRTDNERGQLRWSTTINIGDSRNQTHVTLESVVSRYFIVDVAGQPWLLITSVHYDPEEQRAHFYVINGAWNGTIDREGIIRHARTDPNASTAAGYQLVETFDDREYNEALADSRIYNASDFIDITTLPEEVISHHGNMVWQDAYNDDIPF